MNAKYLAMALCAVAPVGAQAANASPAQHYIETGLAAIDRNSDGVANMEDFARFMRKRSAKQGPAFDRAFAKRATAMLAAASGEKAS